MTPVTRGIVRGLPIGQYHAAREAVSKSGLDDIERSPFHFRRMRDPDAPAREETAAQRVGNMAHCIVLEPARFADSYPVGPDVKTRAHGDWKAFEATLRPDQTGLKPGEDAQAQAIAASVRAHPQVAELLANGEAEVSAYWPESVTVDGEPFEVRCRCRPDWVHTLPNDPSVPRRRVLLLDLKTFGNVGPQEFAKQVASMRYQVQAAYYSDGYAKAAGVDVVGFLFAAVEVGFPHAVAAYMLTDEDLADGRTKYRRNLTTYAQCLKSGTWPGPAPDVTVINLPAWAKESTAA